MFILVGKFPHNYVKPLEKTLDGKYFDLPLERTHAEAHLRTFHMCIAQTTLGVCGVVAQPYLLLANIFLHIIVNHPSFYNTHTQQIYI